MVIFIESIIGCILFTIPIFILSKNPIEGIHDYPPAIIAKVKEKGIIDDTQVPGSKKVIVKKSLFALIIVFICAVVVYYINGARGFLQGFGYTYLLWTIVDWYDAIIIDCLWFCHDKRFVIPGTEGMKEYKDYWFHIKGSVKGMLIGLPVALLVGVMVALVTFVVR
ncbi:MAG: hypothetical protein IJZ23_10565 [Roseburia sp.]|nr:hypothetical protein [Roseburia sp.]